MTFAKNQRLTHGVSSPMVRVRPVASDDADGDGTYPSRAASAWTRRRVASETFGRPRRARETVAVDTPAALATSSMPATRGDSPPCPGGSRHPPAASPAGRPGYRGPRSRTREPHPAPGRTPMIELRTPREIEQMKPAGRFVADVLTTVRAATKVGTNLLELDEIAHRMIRERGAESCYIDYHPSFGASPFGKVICTSVNDAVLHGLPHDYALRDGDLLSIDFAASVDGWVSDSALSFVVGTPREGALGESDRKIIETTERALEAGIAAAQVGKKVGDISAAIADVAHAAGYSVNTDFGGHGVGRTMHGEPHVPNDGRRKRGFPLKPGLVIAVEPWFLETTDEIFTDPDGWTLRSADGSRGAHSEHTIAITPDGPIVLTAREPRE